MRLGSFPIKRVIGKSYSGSYEKREAHVLKLESGQYALVVEEGCSCYTSDQAEIELFPNKGQAMKKFSQWNKRYEGRHHD